MCDFSGKLIAWMDRELPESEAADVERHLEGCAECRSRVTAYWQASRGFETYCDALVPPARRRLPRWMPVAAGAGAAAAVVVAAFLLVFPRGGGQRAAARSAASNVTPTDSPEARSTTISAPGTSHLVGAAAGTAIVLRAERPAMKPVKRVRRQDGVASAQLVNAKSTTGPIQNAKFETALTQNANSLPVEPDIEIDIPADAMFPPGAVPDGMNFTADLTIAADGSTQRLSLRPRLAGFERRLVRQ